MPDQPIAYVILQYGVAATDAVAKSLDVFRFLERKIADLERRIMVLEDGSTQEPPSTP